MPYRGGKLKDFFTAGGRAATDRLGRNVADAAGAYMTDRAQSRTPVRTGASRASIVQKRVRRTGGAYESGAQSSDPNVARLETGTRPHVIMPRAPGKALVFTGPAGTVFASRVNHPGTKGLHMFAIAAAETQRELPKLAAVPLQEWKKEVEASVIKRGQTSNAP